MGSVSVSEPGRWPNRTIGMKEGESRQPWVASAQGEVPSLPAGLLGHSSWSEPPCAVVSDHSEIDQAPEVERAQPGRQPQLVARHPPVTRPAGH